MHPSIRITPAVIDCIMVDNKVGYRRCQGRGATLFAGFVDDAFNALIEKRWRNIFENDWMFSQHILIGDRIAVCWQTIPQSDFPVSTCSDASGQYWTGSAQDRVTAARNRVWRTLKCVTVVTSIFWVLIKLDGGVRDVFTLQTRLLSIGWRHVAPRRIRRQQVRTILPHITYA